MEMTIAEAAPRLDVSPRQVQRLIATGVLTPARRVGRSWLVDAASVARMTASPRGQGRPWLPTTAWAGLWRLSGLPATWLDRQASRRLDAQLARIDPTTLAWRCRARAETLRLRISESYLAEAASLLRPTGASALDPARDLLAAPARRLDGYTTPDGAARLASEMFAVTDPAGNVTARVTQFAAVAVWTGAMPDAVIGVDLLESDNPRERTAGRDLLERLLT
jgi:excisionase family DNA binding protein